MDFESSKTNKYMNILSYIDVLVNIKASALIYIDKGVFIFDSLLIAYFIIKIKGILPNTRRTLYLPIYKRLFVK